MARYRLKRKCFDQGGNTSFLENMIKSGKAPGGANYNADKWENTARHIFGDGNNAYAGNLNNNQAYRDFMTKNNLGEHLGNSTLPSTIKATTPPPVPKSTQPGMLGKMWKSPIGKAGLIGGGALLAYGIGKSMSGSKKD